ASTTFIPIEASHADEEWYTFGRDQHRTRDSLDASSVPPLDFRWKLEGIGWSISQSVMDRNFIYHIAGGYLYKIPIDLGFYDWNASLADIMPEFQEKGGWRIPISN